jgi:hypothetical protein
LVLVTAVVIVATLESGSHRPDHADAIETRCLIAGDQSPDQAKHCSTVAGDGLLSKLCAAQAHCTDPAGVVRRRLRALISRPPARNGNILPKEILKKLNEYDLFPDLDGLGKCLARQHHESMANGLFIK